MTANGRPLRGFGPLVKAGDGNAQGTAARQKNGDLVSPSLARNPSL
jgi:hypothetical protein